ncbi:GGDEF domain-containing protein [Couchioplanes azureus]|uniref:GGDEF domain-containing protein n=1 Tax=Couchioplanes caeruleus TaxID=56438 RepID=UPI0016701ECF|nr:GGDEF domain-containing protein [Couchioplanes caeruleus]
MPSPLPHARVRAVRNSALRAGVVPLLCVPYLVSTWPGEHHPAMAVVVAVLLGVSVLTAAAARLIARSRLRRVVQLTTLVATVEAYAALAWLDGGVFSTMGGLLPFAVMLFAVTMPPRAFVVTGAFSAVAYWVVVLTGGPAPPGYAAIYTAGIAWVAFACLRYAGAMASLRRRLAEQSRIDPLTQCLNRRGFDERLAGELAEAERTGEPAVLLLIDLDSFKAINDTYGHRAGDDLLAFTGRTLTDQLRAHDAVGRVGGDEFAAVLSGIDAAGAEVVVSRLYAALDGTASASIGYACYPAEATTVEELKHLADERVYQDKARRHREVPAAEAVSRVLGVPSAPVRATVSPLERRRRAIAAGGLLGMADPFVGLVWVLVFAAGHPHRLALGVLLVIAIAVGAVVRGLATPLSRLAAAGPIVMAATALEFAIALAVVALDGGVGSPLAFGLFAPMPFVVMTTPRLGRPLIAAIAVGYLGIAVFVGSPGIWFALTHLTGALAVTAVCATKAEEAARQRRRLSELSQTDALTSALNRRGFTERFTAELSHAQRHHRALALLLIDLDGFKQVNDSRGHAAGDELLVWVATVLKDNLHSHDVVGRLGGDEFVVLLTSHDAPDVAQAAAALRSAISPRIGASIGTAVLGEHGEDFDALYTHADADLYAHKSAAGGGRSRRPSPPAVSCEHSEYRQASKQ